MIKWQVFLMGATLALASYAGAIDSLFYPVDEYLINTSPNSIISGDFDNDGDRDVALAKSYNYFGQSVSIYFNDGSGQLNPPATYDIAIAVRYIISADFDRDNDLDLAVSFYPGDGPGGIVLLSNDGAGAFGIGGVIPAGEKPYQLRAGDLDGDSDIDLAVANNGAAYITLLFNNGTGSFAAPIHLTTEIWTRDIRIADLDNDSDPDIAVANYESPGFSIFNNSGGGTFLPEVAYPVAYGPVIIGPSDIDDDGDIDLIVLCSHNDPSAAVAFYYLNDGNGNFSQVPIPPQTVAGGYFEDAVLGDFTNDGLDDFAVVSSMPEIWGWAYVWVNSGDGSFHNRGQHQLHSLGHAIGSADLDADDDLDLVAGHIMGFVTMFNRTVYPCGDANADEIIGIDDAVYLINFIFEGGPPPFPLGAGDANCDGDISVSDAVYLIIYIFENGPEPCCP